MGSVKIERDENSLEDEEQQKDVVDEKCQTSSTDDLDPTENPDHVAVVLDVEGKQWKESN